jgi:hypothetical protein
MSRIVSFRGQIADQAIDTIVLHTTDGSTGYRIVKFELMPKEYGGTSNEHTVQIFKTPQTVASAVIDFSDNRLIAAGSINNTSNATNAPAQLTVIFDNEIFNQDIFVTHIDNASADPVNYYIELEQMPLDLNENTVATLKDIRNVA